MILPDADGRTGLNRCTLIVLGAAAAAMALLLRRAGVSEDLDWETAPRAGRLVDVDGYSVHVVEQGAGPALVMVHGFGGQTYSYRHLIPAFARDHRVVALDLKGFGYSERSATTGLARADQVRMLAGLLDRLGIAHAVLIGHSMGGGVVQEFAATHPGRVDALVLAASVAADERVVRFRPPSVLLRPVLPLLARLAGDRLLRVAYHDPAAVPDDVRAEYRRPERIRGSLDGLLRMMEARASEPLPDLSSIGQPVLLLWGAHDRVVPLAVAQRLRARIPHARLVVIDRAGHMLLEERPAECERAVRDFLADCVRTTGREAGAAAPPA
jgi:pimeloyl-ACP methyl ester carboxylesterase